MAKTHELKTWVEYWIDVAAGEKRFEYRENDRDFRVGDTLVLKCYDHVGNYYTGDEISVKITYLLDRAPGLPVGYCVMGIEVLHG